MKRTMTSAHAATMGLAIAATMLAACDRSLEYDTNLLKNGSFEEVGSDGIPKGWKLVLFKGAPDEPEVVYGVDTLAVDGKRSWYFRADPGTRRFYYLQQEMKVKGATQVRIKGWILAHDVRLKSYQSAMCNFLLTFYDKDHERFQMERPADRRTPLLGGTHPWEEQVYIFDVPEGTHYIAVSCLLGMNGEAWFDDVSIDIPRPFPWETQTTKNYVFHWLPGHPMPSRAPEEQQTRFDIVCQQLNLKSDIVINYYFYPDTTAIQRMTGIRGVMYTNWDDYEFHTLMPGDDHELVHFITDSIGRPPRSIAEGTVYWLQDRWGSVTLDEQIGLLVKTKRVTPFTTLFEYDNLARTDPQESLPTAAAFVKFIVAKWGSDGLLELYRAINGMNAYLPITGAFESTFRVPLVDAEKEFHEWLKANYGK